MSGLSVELIDVVKRFGAVTAVDGVSLAVPTGSVYGFLGPNGAGKTTTIRMIMNILKPDEGRVTVLGGPSSEEVKSRIGYLPEERGLYKKMRVLDLVTYFAALKGMDGASARRRAAALLDELELGNWGRHRCQDLSKGMQQKVQFIATIVHEPELVILDEPFSGLDPVNVDVLKDRILALKRRNATVLFSTHVMDQAEKLCDAVVLIDRGRKVLDGPLAAVMGGALAEDAIHVEYDGDGRALAALPMVARVNDFGKYAEFYLRPGAAPGDLLAALVPLVAIRRFEVRHPTLHEIFVRSVRRGGVESGEPGKVGAAPAAGEAR